MAPRTTPAVGGMGPSIKRKEDPRFIRGQGRYVDDIQLPGMLYLDIVRSPFAHAKIKSINTERALKVPGVLAVITGETLAKYRKTSVPITRLLPGASERYYFHPGDLGFPVVETPFGIRLGVIICYERNLPEPARCVALAPYALAGGPWAPRDDRHADLQIDAVAFPHHPGTGAAFLHDVKTGPPCRGTHQVPGARAAPHGMDVPRLPLRCSAIDGSGQTQYPWR